MFHQDWMRLALEQAQLAAQKGEVPIGAAIVQNGKLIALAGNDKEGRQDPTGHAEILAIRQASAAMGSWRLTGSTLYVTLEPCPMCAGALVAGRVGRIVFGAVDPKAGACGSLYNLCSDPRLNHEVAITPGIKAAECGELLSTFFAKRRDR